jgi:hypothetical protein
MKLGALAVAALMLAGGSLAADEPAGTDSLLESPQRLADALGARFGQGLRIRHLSIQPASADVEAQDPARPENVDRYAFEDGAFGPPEPVQAGRNRREREARLFPLVEVDLSLVPRVVADARRRAETEEARVIQVVIERSEGNGSSGTWGRPLMRFIVDGPRGGAVVEYDLKGVHKRTSRW